LVAGRNIPPEECAGRRARRGASSTARQGPADTRPPQQGGDRLQAGVQPRRTLEQRHVRLRTQRALRENVSGRRAPPVWRTSGDETSHLRLSRKTQSTQTRFAPRPLKFERFFCGRKDLSSSRGKAGFPEITFIRFQ